MVLGHTSKSEGLPWHPTVEGLQKRLLEMPSLLVKFFQLLISTEATPRTVPETTSRLAESFAQDMVFAITKGTFLTLKHTALGIGLHSITDLKLPIMMLSRLGHSLTNDTVREIETAQVELVEHFYKDGKTLPILPKDESSIAPTVFWWDSFDRFVDVPTGAGSIHNTPGVAFQEVTEETVNRADISISRSKRRSLNVPDDPPPSKKDRIEPKTNPKLFEKNDKVVIPSQTRKNKCLRIWKVLRRNSRKDQKYPRFSGWIFNTFKK